MRDFWDKLENIFGDFSKYYPNGHGINPFTFLLAPILGFLFLLFLFLGNWKSITHWFDRTTTSNKVVVRTQNNLDPKFIRISWKMDYTNEVDVYKHGDVLYTEFFERGNNQFSVSYKDSSIARVMHYKETGLTGHTYEFSISKPDSCLSVALEIRGESDSISWINKSDCELVIQ